MAVEQMGQVEQVFVEIDKEAGKAFVTVLDQTQELDRAKAEALGRMLVVASGYLTGAQQ